VGLGISLVVVGVALLIPTLVVLGRRRSRGHSEIGVTAVVVLLLAVATFGIGVAIIRAAAV
jgi:hypothetical protein